LANKFPTEKKEKIGPPGENTELLILKKENKAAVRENTF
jgi:hypothetical protein